MTPRRFSTIPCVRGCGRTCTIKPEGTYRTIPTVQLRCRPATSEVFQVEVPGWVCARCWRKLPGD